MNMNEWAQPTTGTCPHCKEKTNATTRWELFLQTNNHNKKHNIQPKNEKEKTYNDIAIELCRLLVLR